MKQAFTLNTPPVAIPAALHSPATAQADPTSAVALVDALNNTFGRHAGKPGMA